MGKNKTLFKKVIKHTSSPIVIDADGLNILAETDIKLPEETIITPHPLEAARLLGISLDAVLADLENSAKN